MEQKLTFEDALFALGLSRDLIKEQTKELQKLRKRIDAMQRKLDAMQRKLDRYKKYARIKHQKESKRIEKECKKITDFFNSGVFVTGRFVKTWRTGETKR